jgi:pimeloyl-ACP methyl ester carboxylesterase
VVGPDYRTTLGSVLPTSWFEQAVADADTFFRVELPALQEWQFTPELARRITSPVLAILGADSIPLFGEGHHLLREWMRQAEPFILDGTSHALQLVDPPGITRRLSAFFERHPMRNAPFARQTAGEPNTVR